MTSAAEISSPFADARHRLIVALDVDSEEKALSLADTLRDSVGAFKIGLQLFTVGGPQLVERFVTDGFKVFLDLKFHDIPNTVAKASLAAARTGVWMFNLHASGGMRMMRTAVEEVTGYCERENMQRPVMIAVTVLTSSGSDTLAEQGIKQDAQAQVVQLARLAREAGMDGVVASAQEVTSVRSTVVNRNFLIVTPGIRSASATVDDQRRVTTLRTALSAGSDYVVIGRPITASSDPRQAVDQMLAELSQ